MAPIAESEVRSAIKHLERHKTGGTSGLNHDFYKDFEELLIPSLKHLYNAIMGGGGVPASFLAATVIPLRKNGDSTDAMDYQPIALLNTAYKLFGRIIAERLHMILPRLISSSQQGFVRGRNTNKTITILKSILATSERIPEETWEECAAVLCIDLRKAYDTLDRGFMMRVLRAYGFSEGFINVIRLLHDGTTTRYLVNGKLSKEWDVNSGIRQGCPLAPLLFILAVGTLGQAIQRSPKLNGIAVPGSLNRRHKFSAFVDDSTVFMNSLKELDEVKRILVAFGDISGLRVQPHKSVLIGSTCVALLYGGMGFLYFTPQRQPANWVRDGHQHTNFGLQHRNTGHQHRNS